MEEQEILRRWVDTWREVGPELEAVRRKDVQQADNLKTLAILERAFNQALQTLPPRSSSGLIEMQKWFLKLR